MFDRRPTTDDPKIQNSIAMITVGKKAPPFTLFDQDDNRVRLADYKGQWVVLYFYPRDDTPGCTKEACEFTAKIRDFDTVDAVVLGCSPDTPECHRAFVKKYSLEGDASLGPETCRNGEVRRLGREGPLREDNHRCEAVDRHHRSVGNGCPPMARCKSRRACR